MVAATLSLRSDSHLLTYCKSVGSELSSSGFWRYLYLITAAGVIHHSCEHAKWEGSHLPPDQLVEDLDEFFYLIGLGGGLDLKEGEGRCRSLSVEVQATRLEEASDDEDVEECVCIFEELQGRSGLDELVGNRVVIALWNGFEVLVHLISEYYKVAQQKQKRRSEPYFATIGVGKKTRRRDRTRPVYGTQCTG